MKYVPDWFPGASFKTRAREVGDYNHALEVDLYRVALEQLVRSLYSIVGYQSNIRTLQERGNAAPSFVAEFLAEHPNATPGEHELCHQVATQFYGGASAMRMFCA